MNGLKFKIRKYQIGRKIDNYPRVQMITSIYELKLKHENN